MRLNAAPWLGLADLLLHGRCDSQQRGKLFPLGSVESSPTAIALGVFSHSKGFGAELLSDSPCFSGADPSWTAKRFHARFHQGFTEFVLPRFHICLSNDSCFRKGSFCPVLPTVLYIYIHITSFI